MKQGSSEDRTDTIHFSGQTGEYFKLWFVNMFLSIITLGIYSAWAKVRNTQYIYGHTHIDDNSFRFLATPIQILKGRIIAFIVFVLYIFISQINPAINIAMALVFLVATPWLIIKGIQFTMRMTAYRNVRFSFEGTYGGVIVHFILLPILGVLSLYLAMPWVLQKMKQYTHNNMTYGGKHFEQKSSARQYYIAVIISIGVAALGSAIILGLSSAVFGGAVFAGATVQLSPSLVAVSLSAFALLTLVMAVYQAIIYNHIMQTLSIDNVVSFDADLKVLPFAMLMLTNLLLIIITFGLAIPVVKIRTIRYITSVTQVSIKPGIDSLINTIEGDHSAFGEEAAGLFDSDLSVV